MTPLHSPRRIVVGVDPFGHSESAILVALDLAERFDAEIELVHGVEPPHPLWPDLTPHDVAAAREAILTRLRASLAGAQLAFSVEERHLVVERARHPAELILSRAEDADLVVLGPHRRRGILDLGSTTGAVLGGRCPVWVQAGPVRVVERILVPLDLSGESLAALRAACAWAKHLEARVLALHCFQVPQLAGAEYPIPGPTYVVDKIRDDARGEFEDAMESFDWGDVPHETRFVEDDPAHRILALQDRVDLVMMGTHGRTGLSAALLGNVARTVIQAGHVPVLALRDPERAWLI